MSLDDDCIDQILEWLPLEDLCSCSWTCKRLQVVCENHFRRKYPHKHSVRINIISDGRLQISPSENYVKYFQNFVKNLEIVGTDNEHHNKILAQSSVISFVKRKCDHNLHKISIRGSIDPVPLFKEIEDVIRNVKCVTIGRLHEEDADKIDAILQQNYHQLTHLHLDLESADNLNPGKLQNFFQQNDNIQLVAWNFQTGSLSQTFCIGTLNYGLNLHRLLLPINAEWIKYFDLIFSQVNVLCDRKQFKSLELKVSDEAGANVLKTHSNRLANWKQFTKIIVSDIKLSEVIPTLRPLVYLKCVVFFRMKYESNRGLSFNEMNGGLPQIEKVQIESIHRHSHLFAIVTLLLRYWINLKSILLPDSENFDLRFSMRRLHDLRTHNTNSSEVTIFTNREQSADATSDWSPESYDSSLVKLKVVEFESDCDACPFERAINYVD